MDPDDPQLAEYRQRMARNYERTHTHAVQPASEENGSWEEVDAENSDSFELVDQDGIGFGGSADGESPIPTDEKDLELWLKRREMEAAARVRQEEEDAAIARLLAEESSAESDGRPEAPPPTAPPPPHQHQPSDEDLARAMQETEWSSEPDLGQQTQIPTQAMSPPRMGHPHDHGHGHGRRNVFFEMRNQRHGGSRPRQQRQPRPQPFARGWGESDPLFMPGPLSTADPWDGPEEYEGEPAPRNTALAMLSMLMNYRNLMDMGDMGMGMGTGTGQMDGRRMHDLMRDHPAAAQALRQIQSQGDGEGDGYVDYDALLELEDALRGEGGGGASAEQIDVLPTHEYVVPAPAPAGSASAGDHDSSADASSRVCVVCMDDMKSGELAKTLPCGHLFHDQCISKWLRVAATCPVCKNRL